MHLEPRTPNLGTLSHEPRTVKRKRDLYDRVKAQIKLRFRDVRKQPCVVTRSFQLTQKSGGKLEKKDLDQVIQTLDEKTGKALLCTRSVVRSHRQLSACIL